MMIRLLVVDQVPLTCTVMHAVLEREPDIEVVGQALSVDEALDQMEGCDLVLINSLPGGGVLELTRTVSRLQSSTRVVVTGLPSIKELILQHVEAGMAGYVLRDDSVEHLLHAIRAAHRGEAVIAPSVAAALMVRIAQLSNTCQEAWTETIQGAELTPREREVLALVRQGLSNQEIATALTIELGTVKNHIHNILRKLNVRSRHDAVAYWLVNNGEPLGSESLALGAIGDL